MEEIKFKIGDQWFYRGNRSPSWLFLAERLDGSPCGIAEKVPADWWPLLEALALKDADLLLERDRAEIEKNELLQQYQEVSGRHIRIIREKDDALFKAETHVKMLVEAMEEQYRQMDFPDLPKAFALTMKRMIDTALAKIKEEA